MGRYAPMNTCLPCVPSLQDIPRPVRLLCDSQPSNGEHTTGLRLLLKPATAAVMSVLEVGDGEHIATAKYRYCHDCCRGR